MKLPVLVCVAALASACASPNPGLAPPGADGGAARLFYPLGIDVAPDGSRLYVANANFDRAFNSGTLVSFATSAFDTAAADPSHALAALPSDATAARLDAFAGVLRVNRDASALYVTTRDHHTLTRVALDAAGLPQCDPVQGCSAGAIDLAAQDLVDPYALLLEDVVFPGATAPEPAIIVSHLTPASAGSGALAKNARVAVIPERLARASDEPFRNGALSIDIGVPSSSSLALDPASRRLYVGGCFTRVSADQAIACSLNSDSTYFRLAPVRSLFPEAGGASVDFADVGFITGGGETRDLAVSSDGLQLYVATARPSALVVVERTDTGKPAPHAVVPLARTPGRMRVLRRASGDLVVVSATQSNSVLVVDPTDGQVLAQLSNVGKSPYELTSHPTATGDRVYASLFDGCGVVAIDVPGDRPDRASVVSTVGSCP